MHFKAPDIGLDLGTCNTVVYVKNEGIVISEPTLVISRRGDKKPIAVGEDAQRMYGRTSDAEIAIHPIRNGMIANYDATVLLLRAFISKAVGESNLVKPRLVMSIPSEIDEVNRKALTAAVRACGLKKVYLIEKPLAAAIGAGLSVFEPEGCMVVDVGGGTTEVAVVSLGGLVVSQSIPVGGVKMDEAIVNHIKHEFKMLIGAKTAEDVKLDLASALPQENGSSVRIRGRDLLSPSALEIDYTAQQAYGAVREPCRAILTAIKWVLERTPPEPASDIMKNGIYLTGRAAQLYALDQYIANELNIQVILAKDPGDCTVLGLGYIVENLALLAQQGRMPQLN